MECERTPWGVPLPSDILSWEENRRAPRKRGGGQNARATGGPGILPVTKWAHAISRKDANEAYFLCTGQDV